MTYENKVGCHTVGDKMLEQEQNLICSYTIKNSVGSNKKYVANMC